MASLRGWLRLCSYGRVFGESIRPIILAAGASMRMGRPKALLDLAGRTCLERALDTCRAAGAGRPIVVVAPASEVLAAIESARLPVDVAINPRPELGQTSSLLAGLGRLSSRVGASATVGPAITGFLIYPVDFPLVRPEDVRALIAGFATRSAGASWFFLSFGGRRGHPVLVDVALVPEFLALPEGASARSLMSRHADRAAYHEVDDDRVLIDMDTPADHVRCLTRLLAHDARLR